MARILLADDDAHTVRIMSLWLTRNGHQTLEARTGAQAMRVLSECGADMLISDINMPEINGLELVEKVRGELKLDIPIIVLSSRCDQTSLAERLKAQGAELYPKPFV
ncbi:MAG: response regulator, partial [Phycisphaerales bacterium]